jgi:peptidoglycan-associated lipoprotein
MTHHRALILLTATLLGASACRTASTEAPTSRPTGDVKDFDEGPSDVHMEGRIAELCEIPTPNFAFDSARIDPDASESLDALAECFTTGRAKDEQLRLVGHADPRGDEEYNFALGQRRASSIAEYLEDKGLPPERIETSSRGELEAAGTDESSFAEDRRVDILLAG